MGNKQLIIVGVVVAVIVGFILYRKNQAAAAAAADPGNSEVAAVTGNYTLPPDLGLQTDNTGGVNLPPGVGSNANVTTSTGAAQALPMHQ